MSGVNWARANRRPSVRGQRSCQQRLGHAGRPLEQHVAPAGERDQHPRDRLVLAHHDAGHLSPNALVELPHGLRILS